MLCYVDMTHPLLLADPARRRLHLGGRLDTALRFQELAGTPCLYQHYSSITPAFVRQHGIRALVLSGVSSHWRQYERAGFAGLGALAREAELPILGICGGHLVLGQLLGALVTRLGRLGPADDNAAAYMPGWRKEWGFLPIETCAPDPLFAGLDARPIFSLAHGRALRTVPQGCTLLATSPECRVQAFRRDGTMLYGVQFHPEHFTLEHPDGRRLLTNFFTLAGFPPTAHSPDQSPE